MSYFSILTSAGLAKLIKAGANSANIVLNKMSVSDDKGEINQNMQILPNEKHKFSINSITPSSQDKNVLIIEGVVSSDVGGFYIRKVGIYSDDGVLFAVGNVPESYKPLLSEGSAKDITIKFYLQIDNSANITLKVDNNITLATRSHVQSELEKLNKTLETKFLPLAGTAVNSLKLNGIEANKYALKTDFYNKTEIDSKFSNEKAVAEAIKALKTDKTGSINKSNPGYAKLENGLIFQWGVTIAPKNEENFSFYFPITFPSTCLNVLMTLETGAQFNAYDCVIQLYTKTTSSATAVVQRWGGGAVIDTSSVHWLAIGY
ncbi:MAG: phage tail protein [Campylobacter sp.]